MKVLFVLENYFPNIGGVETLFKALVEQLVVSGYKCTVITSRLRPDDPIREEMPGLTIIRIPVSNRYLFTLMALRPIFKTIRSCDLVQTTSYNAALPAFIGAALFRKRIVVTFHEAWGRLWFRLPYMGKPAKFAHYLFEQLLLRLPFDRFVAVSKSTAERLEAEGVSPKRITTIYNGIDYNEFTIADQEGESRDSPFTFTYFGRLGISKGLDLLLEAAVDLKERIPESRLQLIVPTVPESFLNLVKTTIIEKGLVDYVSIRHHLPFAELKKTIAASDCVVIPSYSEGFCFAAVETVALGRPIVSSGQAALPEVIGGRFVQMEALTSKALVEAMLKAYRGEWEVHPKRRFELENTVRAYLRTYREILPD